MSAIETSQDRPVENKDDDDPLLGQFAILKRDVKEAYRARSKWRKEAQQCFDFEAGHQWSDEDKRILESQNRPTITFNRTHPLIAAICGLELNNRQGVTYLPRGTDPDDTAKAETFNAANKWARDECHAEDEESECFKDLTICGEGWTETRMDFDEDPMGVIMEERIYPLEMGTNKGAFRSNYSDARMIYRVREMDPDDVRALLDLPDELIAEAMDASKWLDMDNIPQDGGPGNKKDYPEETPDRIRSSGSDPKRTVTVVQCQYWKREDVHMVAMQGADKMEELSPQDFVLLENRKAQSMLTDQPIQYEATKTRKKVYYECFLGQRLLAEPRKLDVGFTFKAMTGYRDHKLKCFFGIVRLMLDPQMWANKWLSQILNIINSNAKGGLMAETDAFVNTRKAEREWSDPTKIIWVKPGSLTKQKIKERNFGQLPAGLDNMMTFAISSIRDVTGVNLELLGQADREQAASLEAQRKQSAMAVLASMFNSLRRYRKYQGKLMLSFILMLPDGTLVRVMDKGQARYIPLIKDDSDSVAKFDIIIDEAPTSPDQKQYIWSITSQIIQMGILPPQATIELLKYSPYPESVVEEIKNAMGMGSQMPPEMLQQRLQQAEEALHVLEGQLKEAMANAKSEEDKNAIAMMQTEIKEYEAQTERLKAQWDARIKAASAVMQREDAQAEGDSSGDGGRNDAGNSAGSGSSGSPPIGDQDFVQLPQGDAGAAAFGGGEESGLAQLNQKFDALAGMLQQLLGGQQPQMEQAPPPEAQPQEPPVGEM